MSALHISRYNSAVRCCGHLLRLARTPQPRRQAAVFVEAGDGSSHNPPNKTDTAGAKTRLITKSPLLNLIQVASWLARLRHKVEAAQALENELTTTIQAPHSGTRASSNIYRPCKDCLRAAEAVKRAAVAVGVQGLDAVSAVEVSTGYGRALCIVLQGMADAVFRQLQLVCR